MNELVEQLRALFPGYHATLYLYPRGGMICADGCEECGTKGIHSVRWDAHGAGPKTAEQAFDALQRQLTSAGEQHRRPSTSTAEHL